MTYARLRSATRPKGRSAFTLVEVMIVAMIVAVLALAVIPGADQLDADRARWAVRVLAADLDTARLMSMGNSLDPCGVLLDADGGGYSVARASNPGAAVADPAMRGELRVRFGAGRGARLGGVTIEEVSLGGDSCVYFSAAGGIDQGADAEFIVRCGAAAYHIAIDADTGEVTVW